jgi:hypothetical protein
MAEVPLVRVIVAMPTRGVVYAELLQAFVNNAEGHRLIVRMVNRETVDVARNRLAAEAIAAANDPELFAPGTDPYVFWIDSDAFVVRGTLTLMMRTLEQHPSIDVLAALFGPRAARRGAAAFLNLADQSSVLVPGVNCERGEVVDVEQVGLISRSTASRCCARSAPTRSASRVRARRMMPPSARASTPVRVPSQSPPALLFSTLTSATARPTRPASTWSGSTGTRSTRRAFRRSFRSNRHYGDRIDPIVRDPSRRLLF